jgi:hypothetical protein
LLWTRSGGGLKLCSRLGLETSRATDFKRKTWNVRWILKFSGNFPMPWALLIKVPSFRRFLGLWSCEKPLCPKDKTHLA